MSRFLHCYTIGLLLLGAGVGRAAEMTPAEAKMRESLRATMLQMRTLQTQKDTVEAAKVEAEQKNEALSAELEALKTKCAAEKEVSEKAIADLTMRGMNQSAAIGELQVALEEWKAAQKKAAQIAATKEAERAKLAAQAVELQKRNADQRVKNLAMYKIGAEILVRYEKFGLGTALTAREPFVGTMRVKLENLVQDYADQLAQQKIKP